MAKKMRKTTDYMRNKHRHMLIGDIVPVLENFYNLASDLMPYEHLFLTQKISLTHAELDPKVLIFSYNWETILIVGPGHQLGIVKTSNKSAQHAQNIMLGNYLKKVFPNVFCELIKLQDRSVIFHDEKGRDYSMPFLADIDNLPGVVWIAANPDNDFGLIKRVCRHYFDIDNRVSHGENYKAEVAAYANGN